MTALHFEDLHEGQQFTTASVVMAEADLVAFATEFDPQPMHIDKERSPLGGLIASGWYTASVAMKLQQEAGLPGVGLTEVASLAWPIPVRPGDEIHVQIEIKNCLPSPDPGHGLVHFQSTVLNGSGETVQIMLGTVLVPRRSPAAQ